MALGTYSTGSGLRLSALLAKWGEERVAPLLGASLYKEGQGILAQSQSLVPVDTGALRASGYVTPPVRTGDSLRVTIGYGGVAGSMITSATDAAQAYQGGAFSKATREGPAGYAIYVHENLEAHHPVGQAKFLELPFNMAKRGMVQRIAADLRAGLTGQGAGWVAPAVGATIELTPQGLLPGGG